MSTSSLTIDYEKHPYLRPPSNGWTCDQKALEIFNNLYRDLELGRNPENWSQLLKINSSIFDAFRVESNDPLEDVFISELHQEVQAMLKNHIDFYTACSPPQRLQFLKIDSDRKCTIRGALTSSTLFKIIKLAECEIQELRYIVSQGKTDRESLSKNTGIKIRRLLQILNHEFKDIGVLDKLSNNFPGRIKVVGAAIELSTPDAKWWSHTDLGVTAPKTLYAHIDEAIDAPKAIIYLSDVSETNGPFCYYPGIYEELNLTGIQILIGRCVTIVGSSINSDLYHAYASSIRRTSSELFRKHFMKLPTEFRFNSHFGWDVTSGSALESAMVNSEIPVVGCAGTYLVFDGARTVHRGGIVQRDQRLVIQVVFGRVGLKVSLNRMLHVLRKRWKS